ncbi:MAG: hypothetical protein K2K21_18975 [Lachnospiraceae bacterium]|nr:hypothetical protein [Lachnospiraceae bacterium]MDE7283577.1 hypothetical protein [Lachnospiraceae bacterium]
MDVNKDRNDEIKEYRKKYSALIAECWQDEDVKKNFMENPKDAFKEYSIPVEESKQYQVIEADKNSTYVVLPYEGAEEAVQSLFKLFHIWSENGNQIIKPGCELRLIQNTADTNYIVLPFNPELYTEEEKMSLQQADGCTTVDVDVALQSEIAIQVISVQSAIAATTYVAGAEVGALVVVAGVIVLI